MDKHSMEKAMLKNINIKTGKSIEEWTLIAQKQKGLKHNELVNYLKREYLITHGYANLIVRKSKQIIEK